MARCLIRSRRALLKRISVRIPGALQFLQLMQSAIAANISLKLDENGILVKLDEFSVVKNQKDTIAFILKDPQVLSTPISDSVVDDCVGKRLCLDEDFCSCLIPKLFELICRQSDASLTPTQLSSIFNFFSVAGKLSIDCQRRLPAWLHQFIPNMSPSKQAALISALPSILSPHPIDGVLEQGLIRNVRDGRKDLAESSLSALLAFRSEELFSSQEIDISGFTDLALLIEAACAFPRNADLRNQVQLQIEATLSSDEDLPNNLVDLLIPFTRTVSSISLDCSLVAFLLLMIKCVAAEQEHRTTESLSLYRQLHRQCLENPQIAHTLFTETLPKLAGSELDRFTPVCLVLFQLLLEGSVIESDLLLDLSQLLLMTITGSERSLLSLLASNVLNGTEQAGLTCLHLLSHHVAVNPSCRWSCLGLVKGLLDGLDQMPPAKLDSFYTLYAHLALDSDTVLNELLLLLKKQLYSFDPVYKRIGAQGVVVFCRVIGVKRRPGILPDPDDESLLMGACSQAPATQSRARIAAPAYSIRLLIGLLEEAVKSVRSDPQAFSLLLSGLASVVQDQNSELDFQIIEWLAEWSTSVFKQEFIREAGDDGNDAMFDCESEGDENALLLQLTGKWTSHVALLFRLLAGAEHVLNDGALDSIDALHACPFKLESSSSDPASQFMCKFACLSLMREMVAVFDPENGKSFKRLECIAQLENELNAIIAKKPAYLDELKFTCLCLVNTGNSKFDDSIEIVELNHELLLSCLKEAKKLTPLKKSSTVDAGAVITANSAREASPLPHDLIIKALKHFSQADSIVYSFALNELRHSMTVQDLPVLLQLWRDGGVNSELIQLFQCKTSEIDQSHALFQVIAVQVNELAGELWMTAENDVLKASAFQLLKHFDPAFEASPVDLITDQNIALVPLLSADQLLQVIQSQFAFESMEEGKASLSLFKALLGRSSELLSVAGIDTLQVPLTCASHLLQYARLRGSTSSMWLSSSLRAIRPGLQGLIKATSPFFTQIEADGVLVQAEERNQVMLLLRQLQQCTRSLQVICSHVKYSALSSSTGKKRKGASNTGSLIPLLKKSLEALIVRVGEAVKRCGCSDAFWVGNLKHRDLEGVELSSQVALMLDLQDSDDDLEEGGDLEEDSEISNVEEEGPNAYLSKEFISSSTDESMELEKMLQSESESESE